MVFEYLYLPVWPGMRKGVDTVRYITKNTYRLLAIMSNSNSLRVMEFGYTEKEGQLLLYSFVYKHADTLIYLEIV